MFKKDARIIDIYNKKKLFRLTVFIILFGVVAGCVRYSDDDIGNKIEGKGVYRGYMWHTYYYLAEEKNFLSQPPTIPLFNSQCKKTATVSSGFFKDLCMQGSGKLIDNRVLSFSKECKCATACSVGGAKVCYDEVDGSKFNFGRSATGKKVDPLRTWAVDTRRIPLGTPIYSEEWDGLYIPKVENLGGFTHDGCFIAHDSGSWVKKNHYDLNAGTRKMWKELERIVPSKFQFAVFANEEKCGYLKKK